MSLVKGKNFYTFSSQERSFPHQSTHHNIPLYLKGNRNKNLFSYQRNNKITDIHAFKPEVGSPVRQFLNAASAKKSSIEADSLRVIYPNFAPLVESQKQNIRYDANKQTTQKDRRLILKTFTQEPTKEYKYDPKKHLQVCQSVKILKDQRSQIECLPGTHFHNPDEYYSHNTSQIRKVAVSTYQRERNSSQLEMRSSAKRLFPQSVNIYQQSEKNDHQSGKRRNNDRENVIYRDTSLFATGPGTDTDRPSRLRSKSPFKNLFESQVKLG